MARRGTIEFGLGAGIAGRCQSGALPLAIVSAFQPLAELFGAVAFLCPLNQGAHAWRPRCRLAAALGTAFRRLHVPWQHVFFPVDELGIRQ